VCRTVCESKTPGEDLKRRGSTEGQCEKHLQLLETEGFSVRLNRNKKKTHTKRKTHGQGKEKTQRGKAALGKFLFFGWEKKSTAGVMWMKRKKRPER